VLYEESLNSESKHVELFSSSCLSACCRWRHTALQQSVSRWKFLRDVAQWREKKVGSVNTERVRNRVCVCVCVCDWILSSVRLFFNFDWRHSKQCTCMLRVTWRILIGLVVLHSDRSHDWWLCLSWHSLWYKHGLHTLRLQCLARLSRPFSNHCGTVNECQLLGWVIIIINGDGRCGR